MKRYRFFFFLLLAAVSVQATLADDIIKVCGQNVQNFFYSLDRERTQGSYIPLSNYNTEEGRNAKAQAIVSALAPYEADIYAFNEVEAQPSTSDKEALDLLAEGMRQMTGYNYKVVKDGMTYDLSTDATGVIKSGFIYRADKIEPVGDNVSTAVGYTTIYPYMMRMQTFRSLASGEQFTVSMNHFKASTSSNINEDIVKREQNSIALLKGLEAAIDPDILLMGDLNSEMGEQCLNNLVDAGYEEQILKWEGEYAYSHWYDYGELIDHVFANSTMAQQVIQATVMHIANPHSVGRYNAYSDHDPFMVTLNLKAQPAPSYGYKKVTTLTAGIPYLMVAPINGLQAALPVSIDKTYEYQLTTNVTEEDGIIMMDNNKDAFIFEEADDGNYRIKDYYGRYLYQYYNTSTGKYTNSTNVGTKQNANTFSVIPQTNGTFKILNTASDCYFIGLTYKGTPEFALYNYQTLYSNQYMPWLYQYDAAADPTGITEEYNVCSTPTRKILRNGQIHIIMGDGSYYNVQGIKCKP
jgi:endonuclease/exonuclease/phosphatase family metal-dependent hydrolase